MKNSIKDEINFQNLLKLNSLISFNTSYNSYEELKRFFDRDEMLKPYFYKTISELQKKEILIHIEENEEKISNKRRL